MAAIPAGIAYSSVSQRFELLHAAALIPVAVLLGIGALLLARRARRQLEWSLGRRGLGVARTGGMLGVLGLGLAVTATISVGFYRLLVYFQ